MTNIKKIFAKNLKQLRISKHLSQNELADLSGLHRTYISSIECGNRNVSLENIQKLADALNIKAYFLLKENDYEN